MAFKMKTSIGKIHANTHGTKLHAKSKATATAKVPTPAKGNVSKPSPFHVEDKRGFIKKAIDGDQPDLKGRTKAEREKANKKSNSNTARDQKSTIMSTDTTSTVKGGSSKTKSKTSSSGSGKKSYKEAYKNADKSKYPTFESFKKAAIKYNRKKIGRKDEKVESVKTAKVQKTQKIKGEKPTGQLSDQTKKVLKERSEKPKSRKQRILEKTQAKGKAIADGKGIKTAKEQTKALRLKKREARLKKRISKSKGPAGYASAAQRKAVHASKAEKKAKK